MSEARSAILEADLIDRHRAGLLWFAERAGENVPWPQPLLDGTILVTRAKGIYKPKDWQHALSVREALRDPYPDRGPFRRTDGGFDYSYYQEGDDAGAWTNRALRQCQEDRVPVGVLIQVEPRPRSRYRVWGVALVESFADRIFQLRGLRSDA